MLVCELAQEVNVQLGRVVACIIECLRQRAHHIHAELGEPQLAHEEVELILLEFVNVGHQFGCEP